jgi:hypothetical protein
MGSALAANIRRGERSERSFEDGLSSNCVSWIKLCYYSGPITTTKLLSLLRLLGNGTSERSIRPLSTGGYS